MPCGTTTRSPLKINPSWLASSSLMAKYEEISAFTSALLSGQPLRIVSLSTRIVLSALVATRSFCNVDCPMGRCLMALICENCPCLSLPSERYAQDRASAMCISLPRL